MDKLQSIVIALKGVRSAMDDRDIGGLLEKVGALVVGTEKGRVAENTQQLLIDFNPWRGSVAEKAKINLLGMRGKYFKSRIKDGIDRCCSVIFMCSCDFLRRFVRKCIVSE
ncbi:MAG: DeoR family transcriptional regulator [Bacilli bacterium]|nr:DeoR family transcriptional regulator [Bacilli bacterium]